MQAASYPLQATAIPVNIIGIPVVFVQNAPTQIPCPTPSRPPSLPRFQNVSEYTRWLLAIHETEHGTYYVPPQTFKGDAYGYSFLYFRRISTLLELALVLGVSDLFNSV